MEVEWQPEELILAVLVIATLVLSAGLVNSGKDGLHVVLGAGAFMLAGLLVTAIRTRSKQRYKKAG